jgi:hypothetical protein
MRVDCKFLNFEVNITKSLKLNRLKVNFSQKESCSLSFAYRGEREGLKKQKNDMTYLFIYLVNWSAFTIGLLNLGLKFLWKKNLGLIKKKKNRT